MIELGLLTERAFKAAKQTLVSHGYVIDEDFRDVLRAVARAAVESRMKDEQGKQDDSGTLSAGVATAKSTLVYTGGACRGTRGPGAWAYAVLGGAYCSGHVVHDKQ